MRLTHKPNGEVPDFKMERGIPIPPQLNLPIFPFSKMKPGDSFIVEHCHVITAHRSFMRRHPGWEFTSRREGNGVRVFCIQAPQWDGLKHD